MSYLSLTTMDQKETFNLFCKERFLEKCINSKTVSAEKGGKAIKHLKGDLPEEDCDPLRGIKARDQENFSQTRYICTFLFITHTVFNIRSSK